MKINREGIETITITICFLLASNVAVFFLAKRNLIPILISIIVSLVFLFFILYFFRNPDRTIQAQEDVIVSPADGKIVIIEKTFEKEYFKDDRLKVSVFMSPLNVHVNRYPISGTVSYCKYHPGKYLVAFHPKSSDLNERSTVVVKDKLGREILVRQIAGAVARRIVTYSKEGDIAEQGKDLGFIKFGSRVDLFLPLDTKIEVELEDIVKGNLTTLASFPKSNK